MASGPIHARGTRRLGHAIVLVATGVALFDLSWLALGLTAGAVFAHLCTPDVDIPHRTHEEWRLWRLNVLLGALYVAYWWLYAKYVPHRSAWSHLPGFATALRLAYAFWWLPPVWHAQGLAWGPLVDLALGAWIAASLQDLLHLHLDDWRLF